MQNVAWAGHPGRDGKAHVTGPTSRGPTHEAAGGEPVFGAEVGRGAPGGGAEVGRRGGGGFGRVRIDSVFIRFPSYKYYLLADWENTESYYYVLQL